MRQNLRLAKWKEAAGSSEAASLFVRPQTRRRFSLFFFSFFFWEDTDDNDNQYHHPLSLASFSTTTRGHVLLLRHAWRDRCFESNRRFGRPRRHEEPRVQRDAV